MPATYISPAEIGFYYLQSRYYDPQVKRFINSDVYVSTGQDLLGFNMYAYCGNNPVSRLDLSGTTFVEFALFILDKANQAVETCKIREAKDLSNDASEETYNCFGNALQIAYNGDPVGYHPSMSAEEIIESITHLVGDDNIQMLNNYDDPIEPGWYVVALRLSEPHSIDDYHFVVYKDEKIYNKNGFNELEIIDGKKAHDFFSSSIWSMNDMVGTNTYNGKYYSGPIYYFAIRKGWNH